MPFRLDTTRESLTDQAVQALRTMATLCRRSIIQMTAQAGSGHPGGSCSEMDLLVTLYATIRHNPQSPRWPERDRVIISKGHASPGVYSVLGWHGYFDIDEAIRTFRRPGAVFGGHVEHWAPGVEFNTGNLGQGLSAACGYALGAKIKGEGHRVYCLMSDGEQEKGQTTEARRFAAKEGLDNLIGIVDCNRLQMDGPVAEVMPVLRIADEYQVMGWEIIEVDGHDYRDIYRGLREARALQNGPRVIVAHTVKGKGISFMENQVEWHGVAPKPEEAEAALAELPIPEGWEEILAAYGWEGRGPEAPEPRPREPYPIHMEVGTPRIYEPGAGEENRKAYGWALADLGTLNNQHANAVTPIVGLSCDVKGSVRMSFFEEACPNRFFQGGIQEHHTAGMAGAMSLEGLTVFFSTFGVFGVDEVYNQLRLSDQNGTNLKLCVTHCGLNVGEDGPTHHCIDYIGLLRNCFGFKLVVPADPNQTDRISRHIAAHYGNYLMAMDRARCPVLTAEDGRPFYGNDYVVEEGQADLLRPGDDLAILAMGPMVPQALAARDQLLEERITARILNIAWLRPLDEEAIILAARETGALVTVEDHHVDSGLGSLVATVLADHGLRAPLTRLGVRRYAVSGKPHELYELFGLGVSDIVRAATQLMERKERLLT